MAEHTKGPWRVDPEIRTNDRGIDYINGFDIRADGYEIVGCEGITGGPVEAANAARIVACVNALEGYNPDAVRDVVKVLKANAVTLGVTRMRLSEREMPVCELNIAIAETKGALARLGGAS